MRVIGYVRISTANREEWEPSRLDQEQAIRGWCAAGGHQLVGIRYDEGVSGTNHLAARVGLPEAQRLIRAGRASGLVVRGIDRLSRDLMVQEAILAELWAIRPDVEVYSTSPDEARICARDDPDEPSRKLVRLVLGAVSGYVRDMTVARLRIGKRAKGARGGFVGGQVPFGFRSVDRTLIPVPAEQAALDRMTELRAGGASLRTIARTLTEEGYRPRGREWHPATLARILTRADTG